MPPCTEPEFVPGAFARLRTAIRTRYAWAALLLVFATCFLPGNATAATNLYRLLVVIPMLLCFRPADVAAIWRQPPARWFLLLSAWLTLALFWDGWSYKDFKLLLRELNVLALFYLTYLVGIHHRARMPTLLAGLVALGLIGAALIIGNWPDAWPPRPEGDQIMAARGVFGHHVEVGRALALVALAALHQTLNASRRAAAGAFGIATLALWALVFWVQARSAYVVTGAGSLLLMALFPGRRAAALILAAGIIALVLAVGCRPELEWVAGHVVERGTALRMPIWRSGWGAIMGSRLCLWFGHGLSADPVNSHDGVAAMHYHNILLNQAFYAGLIGAGLYLTWIASLLKTALGDRRLWLWGTVVAAMQLGFITDGNHLFVNPSSTLLAFLLPAFLLGFRVPAPARELKRL